MSNVLLIHYHKPSRTVLESLARNSHKVEVSGDVVDGAKKLIKQKPDVVVISHDSKKQEGFKLLRYMKRKRLKTPVVVVVPRGGGAFRSLVSKFGAKGFLEAPVSQAQFDQAITKAVKAPSLDSAGRPPISEEELNSNITMLEKELNRKMKCFAGKNQVYIQALIMGGGTTKPRVCIKCSLREEFGLNRDVYYEFIRDICCSDPSTCEAVEKFGSARELV